MTRLTVLSIDTDQCIGCAQCLRVCPTDAILGSPESIHIIAPFLCIGCQLCVPVCPVDCIHLTEKPVTLSVSEIKRRQKDRKTRLKGDVIHAKDCLSFIQTIQESQTEPSC